jgi:hypothetical protein
MIIKLNIISRARTMMASALSAGGAKRASSLNACCAFSGTARATGLVRNDSYNTGSYPLSCSTRSRGPGSVSMTGCKADDSARLIIAAPGHRPGRHRPGRSGLGRATARRAVAAQLRSTLFPPSWTFVIPADSKAVRRFVLRRTQRASDPPAPRCSMRSQTQRGIAPGAGSEESPFITLPS